MAHTKHNRVVMSEERRGSSDCRQGKPADPLGNEYYQHGYAVTYAAEQIHTAISLQRESKITGEVK